VASTGRKAESAAAAWLVVVVVVVLLLLLLLLLLLGQPGSELSFHRVAGGRSRSPDFDNVDQLIQMVGEACHGPTRR
jgi:hypothetical protein